jgi:hypothetical protein
MPLLWGLNMTKLGQLTPVEALSPVGLPEKVTYRVRLNLFASGHPVLLRYIEELDEGTLGPVVAAFAEVGVRARLGMGTSVSPHLSSVQPSKCLSPEVGDMDHVERQAGSDRHQISCASEQKSEYDEAAMSAMFPQFDSSQEA